MTTNGRSVVFIGAGPAAITVFLRLKPGVELESVTFVDPNPVGAGNVFGELCADDFEFMCNSSVALTSLRSDDPDDFVRFLREHGWQADRDTQVPRYIVGFYTVQRAREHAELLRRSGTAIKHVSARAVEIEAIGDDYSVHLSDGSSVPATDIVLAAGLEKPIVPRVLDHLVGDPRYYVTPYPGSKLRELPAGSKILVVGMKASALDALVALRNRGHEVAMCSRSGEFASVRDIFRYPPEPILPHDEFAQLDLASESILMDVYKLLERAAASRPDGTRLEDQISADGPALARLREDVALAEDRKTRWSDMIYESVNILNDLSRRLDWNEHQALAGTLRPHTRRYIASIPVELGRLLVDGLDSGWVSLVDMPSRVDRTGQGFVATFPDEPAERHFDYIVSASGYHPPRFYDIGGGRLTIDRAPADVEHVIIDGDFRVPIAGAPQNRIWAVGPSTGTRVPYAHLVWVAALQAAEIADAIHAAPVGIGAVS
ncbi:FAD/NAD(P)-binding protein [Streptomyces sp. GD-15H]|uniref:FAD/NAD(P)-binding protein n=1 Tax=Streptomyces sp. GD-15H TaxID=3129112 RepID=UPI003245790C